MFQNKALQTSILNFPKSNLLYNGARLYLMEGQIPSASELKSILGESTVRTETGTGIGQKHRTTMLANIAGLGNTAVVEATLPNNALEFYFRGNGSETEYFHLPWTDSPDNIEFIKTSDPVAGEDVDLTWALLCITGYGTEYVTLVFKLSVGDLNSDADIRLTKTTINPNTRLRISDLTINII